MINLPQGELVILKAVHERSRRQLPVYPHDLQAELQMACELVSRVRGSIMEKRLSAP
jgi:hypothetical protein